MVTILWATLGICSCFILWCLSCEIISASVETIFLPNQQSRMCDKEAVNLRENLQFLAPRMLKVTLQRAEEVFPALKKNMADATTSNVALSNLLLNSSGSTKGNTCKRCDESEIQLNEALSELSSAQTIISILQKELILAKTSTSIDPDIRLHNEPDTEAWKPITYNTRNKVNPQKKDRPSLIGPTSFNFPFLTTNRYSPLANLVSDEHASAQKIIKSMDIHSKASKIPTIINGINVYYSEPLSVISNQEDSPNITSPQKKAKNTKRKIRLNKVKHKVLFIGDSHARKCAQLLPDNLNTDFKVTGFVKPSACMSEGEFGSVFKSGR